jgi:dTDP-4-amino-4,6-dideoxy-D-galactose acyltransferase
MIRPLEWDSRHFGIRIGRVEGDTLSEASARAYVDERVRFDCVYLLADANHVETSERAHQLGFRMVDIRVTLARPLEDPPGAATRDDTIREAVVCDLPRLEALAAASYHDSRFYFDRGFARDRVDELYRIWLRNDHGNPSARVLVVDDATGPAGYTSCTVKGADAEIGLVAIAEAARGTGKAQALLARARGWAATHGARRMTVVTQGRNVAAQRLYERAGFQVQHVGVWYHAWPT